MRREHRRALILRQVLDCLADRHPRGPCRARQQPVEDQLRPVPGAYESAVGRVMKRLYDERMKLTGQNGLSDYDIGFTNFLHTFSKSPDARQPTEHARI